MRYQPWQRSHSFTCQSVLLLAHDHRICLPHPLDSHSNIHLVVTVMMYPLLKVAPFSDFDKGCLEPHKPRKQRGDLEMAHSCEVCKCPTLYPFACIRRYLKSKNASPSIGYHDIAFPNPDEVEAAACRPEMKHTSVAAPAKRVRIRIPRAMPVGYSSTKYPSPTRSRASALNAECACNSLMGISSNVLSSTASLCGSSLPVTP